MIEETSVEQEVVVTEQPQQEVQELQEQPQQQAAPVETPQQKNFKAIKQAKERAERERDDLMRQLQEHQQAKQSVPEEPAMNPDDLVEARYVDKKIKNLEEQLRAQRQQTETMAVESRLKAQYPDFDSVVSKDNLDMLHNAYPELGYTLKSSSDLYSKAVSAYTMIKRLGIQAEDPYLADKELAQRNAAKPKSLASVSPQQGESLHRLDESCSTG